MPNREIPESRKALYHAGQVVAVIGLLTFLSTFVIGAFYFGDFSNFHSLVRNQMLRAIGGMVMIVAGGAMMNVAARGVAGSGLTLDPQRARGEVEPWTRMAGGMAKDALDEAGLDLRALTAAADIPFDEKLRRLHALWQDGILREDEYLREKQDLLDKH
ncbi:hypothetical protein Pla175_03450 [Pirellulimonas nuda]|uniref:SHOCT domain-containing protein n=1 Tax=Pirellulimonas nuda TaxID=2528009 RepID=A0A518D6A3_9BACT|nr:SHOCT domain-containing protein [Pirellulimonas nuda]QDU86991.1 hypothetical protein Pla175_03450 [Pirellulimonas nuda]